MRVSFLLKPAVVDALQDILDAHGELLPLATEDGIELYVFTTGFMMSHFLEEWISIGKQLGTLEDEKPRLAPERAPNDLVTARNKWIRTVNLLLALAEEAELEPQTDPIIFAPLHAAEAKAEKRGRAPVLTPENHSEPVP